MLAIFMHLAPSMALALLGTVIGIEAFSPLFGRSDILVLAVFAGLAFAALSVFKGSPGQRAILLFLFAVLLARTVSLVAPEIRGFSWSLDALWAFLIIAVMALVSSALKYIHPRMRLALWGMTMVYFLGWIAIAAGIIASRAQVAWALLGTLVFSIATIAFFVQSKTRNSSLEDSSLAFELFIMGFNLALAARILRTGEG
jgi:FtsH-binding integral membrane protein